jgi:hypothetical protein
MINNSYTIATFVLLILPHAASASTIPLATGFAEADTTAPEVVNNGAIVNGYFYAYAASNGPNFTTVGALINGMVPTLSVSAGGPGASGIAKLTYFFEISGPSTNIDVPVYVDSVSNTYALGPDPGTTAYATTGLVVTNPSASNNDVYETACSGVGGGIDLSCNPGQPKSFSINQKVLLAANTIYAVEMTAEAVGTDGLGGSTGGEGAKAVVDPYIYIDPAFLASNSGYAIEFSDGIGNEPLTATPLPAALPLFGTTLAGFAGAGWLRRKSNQAIKA